MSGSFIPSNAPPPPYPATMEVRLKGKWEEVPLDYREIDLRALKWMPLNVGRLLGSEFYTRREFASFYIGVTLWCRAWHQVPAGSLPSDERQLATIAGVGDLRAWRRVAAAAMHGFILCNDGRYYHPVICEAAVSAYARSWGGKRAASARWKGDEPEPEADPARLTDRAAPAARQGDLGLETGERTANVRHGVQRNAQNVAISGRESVSVDPPHRDRQVSEKPQDTSCDGINSAYALAMPNDSEGTRTIVSKKGEAPQPETPPAGQEGKTARGTRLPDDWMPAPELIAWAREIGFNDGQIKFATEQFRDHFHAKSGKDGIALRWDLSWRKWLRCEDPMRLRSSPETHRKTNGVQAAQPGIVDDMTWRLRLERAKAGKRWMEEFWGPPPEDPKCLAPVHLLIEFGYRSASNNPASLPTTSRG